MFAIALILCGLPAVFTSSRLLRREALSMFDFLQLFASLFFVVIPFFGSTAEYSEHSIWRYTVVYGSFSWLLWFIQVTFRRSMSRRRVGVLDVTAYISRYRDLRLNWIAHLIIAVVLTLVILVYLPQQALVLRVKEIGATALKTYEDSVLYHTLGVAFSLVGLILSFAFVSHRVRKTRDPITLVLFGVYMFCALLSVRRDLIYAGIVLLVILYSLNRGLFNLKFLALSTLLAGFVLGVYFPFYNVIRISPIRFNPDRPVASVVSVFQYGFEHFGKERVKATSGTQERSFGLSYSLLRLLEYETQPQMGELTAKSIDNAIPRALNPNKGEGIGNYLEKLSRAKGDISDSLLTHGVGEYGTLGGIFATVFYLTMFLLYQFYARVWSRRAKSHLIPLYILFVLLSYTWNIETLVIPFFSWFFASFLVLLVLLVMEKTGCIALRLKDEE